MNTVEKDIKIGEVFTVSLMLTEKCNFNCRHCFYSCGPNRQPLYMSDDILSKVKLQMDELRNIGVSVDLNLIGGEPTLNMSQFKRVMDIVSGWDMPIFMSTNGWWLHRERDTARFFKIMSNYIRSAYPEDFSIRISQDIYHKEHRPQHLDINNALIYWFNKGQYNYDLYMPIPNDGWPYIYVENDDSGDDSVIPSGERSRYFGRCDVGERGNCSVLSLTYKPNGKHIDGCCRGSNMPFGDVTDHPLVLLKTIRDFVSTSSPVCRDCHELAKDYSKNVKKIKGEIASDLMRFNNINTSWLLEKYEGTKVRSEHSGVLA